MPPLAVIDVGSNSGRAVVLSLSESLHLETIADGQAPLRLARDLREGTELSDRTITRTVEALRDFTTLARGSAAAPVLAVATAAVREASNSDELVGRALQEAGLQVVVIDGETEARFSFLGAVHGLPVEHGLLIDIGGGSLEVTRFRKRELVGSWTLPLGALRLSDRFLLTDPPAKKEIESLRQHTADALAEAGVPTLESDEHLVGTGGTVRNMAKMDRHTRPYPVSRLHGYVLTRRRLDDLAARLASRAQSRRRSTPGLTAERADSIVGGALVAQVAMETVGAAEIVVSGQGLREGIALDTMGPGPTRPEEVREASIQALAARFATWEPERAARRMAVTRTLLAALEPDAGPRMRERLAHAAHILDIGRSLDYYRRYEHAADMLLAADLAGFTHRKLALLSAVVRTAGDEGMRIRTYRPLLGPDDQVPMARAGTILLLADEIEHRMVPGGSDTVACEDRGNMVSLRAPIFDPWRREALAARFRRVFRKKLVIEPSSDSR